MFPLHVGATNHYQISIKPTCSARPGEDMRRDGQHFSARGCKVGSATVTSRPVLLFTFSLLCCSRALDCSAAKIGNRDRKERN